MGVGLSRAGSAIRSLFQSAATNAAGKLKQARKFFNSKSVASHEPTHTTRSAGRTTHSPRPETRITNRRGIQVPPAQTFTSQPTSKDPAQSAQSIRLNLLTLTTRKDQQVLILASANAHKQKAAQNFQDACDRVPVSTKDALATKRFPKLQREFVSAVRSEKLAQATMKRLDNLIDQSQELLSGLDAVVDKEVEIEFHQMMKGK